MKDLDIRELSRILEEQGLTERLEFSGRISVQLEPNNWHYTIFNYKGKASIKPESEGSEYYFLTFNNGKGKFTFKPTDKFKINFYPSIVPNSINHDLSSLIVHIDISPNAEIHIDKLSDIKY